MNVIDRFVRVAGAHAEHAAVVDAGSTTSYATLLLRARAFAARFARADRPRVLIALPQVADAYASIFGAGLAGGCYTPLNLAAPMEKLRRIAGLLDPDVVVADPDIAQELQAQTPRAEFVDPVTLDESDALSAPRERHDLAYILFTSGSTGEPKGVMLPRSALDHYVDWLGSLGFGPGDRVAQQGNLAFDISVTDVYGALCYGASLHPVSAKNDKLMPARMIAREKITVWNSVPSLISLMMQANQVTAANLASVRLFNFCGEPLLPEHLDALFAARPDLAVQNTYGPTEATVAVTALPVAASTRQRVTRSSVALGEPIPGMSVTLVGGSGPDEGEIVISGPQLADGYWNDPTKTASAFRDCEIEGRTVRGYYTGDWAERRDGLLFFKERLDFQVKVRGFRIELDEVAAAIRACGWPVACVLKHGEALAAVVERVDGLAFGEAALRDAIAAQVEQHAVPVTILEIERMPRNDNDKLDRKAAERWLIDRVER